MTTPRSASRLLICVLGLFGATALPRSARAQWSTTYEQFYLQASHNWTFRTHYQNADRLFNAFDYGHAILYETLWRFPDASAARLEVDEYTKLTTRVLTRPPRLPLEEAAIEVKYAQLAPEAKVMFDWAHILHRQIYDVLADERLLPAAKDAEVARLIRYYKSRPDLAFSSKPKSMALMQEQPYSLAFRQRYPKFNGLIWGYHWLQMGLYEPLLVGTTVEQRQAGVRATVARFWQMLTDAPRTLPYQMPMTVAVAPVFAGRYPEAAIIFDNLHSMHDVVSDILANPQVPRAKKRAEILRAAERYRDDSSFVMTVAAWRTMSEQMGVENMGGSSVGFLPTLPTPTVTAGAVMQHDPVTGAMTGFGYGSATGGAHAMHATSAIHDLHAGHVASPVDSAAGDANADALFMQRVMGYQTQALQLTPLVATRTNSSILRSLADTLAISRREELAAVQQWLEARKHPVPAKAMLSAAQRDTLTAARGAAFDRLWLQSMNRVLEDALTMVSEPSRPSRPARDPQTVQLVARIETSVRATLLRVKQLLDAQR